MKFHYLLGLLLCLFVGCSKSNNSTAAPKKVDLGTVNVTYDTPTKQDIGDGRSCVIKVSKFMPGQCELIVNLQKSGKTIETKREMPALLDKPTTLEFEGYEVTVTPHVQ